MNNHLAINVTIRDRNNTLFAGEAFSVTAKNSTGVFDVLPQHANFISLIEGDIQIQKIGADKLTFQAKKGVLRVKQDNVSILIEN